MSRPCRRMNQSLYLKHLIATSRLHEPAAFARKWVRRLQNIAAPTRAMIAEEDEFVRAAIRHLVRNGDNCVDLGAHVGSISYLFQRISPDGQHIAVEADPIKARWLKKRFPGTIVYNCAITAENKDTIFYRNLDQSGFSSLSDHFSDGRTEPVAVSGQTLDTVVPMGTRVDFLKIDVEGFEWEAIKGGQQLIHAQRPAILFEAGATEDPNVSNEKYRDLFNHLTHDQNYAVYPCYSIIYRKQKLDLSKFEYIRQFPFLSFNFIALPLQY